jgi:hypothetical protein
MDDPNPLLETPDIFFSLSREAPLQYTCKVTRFPLSVQPPVASPSLSTLKRENLTLGAPDRTMFA